MKAVLFLTLLAIFLVWVWLFRQFYLAYVAKDVVEMVWWGVILLLVGTGSASNK